MNCRERKALKYGPLTRDFKDKVCLAGMAHVDYTAESGIDRLDALLPDEAEKLRETPFAVVQVHLGILENLANLEILILKC